MSGSSWRSPSTADQYRHHDYADFAQEFLQRNAEYVQDHADTIARIAAKPETDRNEKEGLAGRWGLCFPHGSGREPAPAPCALVSRRCARRCRADDRRHSCVNGATTQLRAACRSLD